MVQDWGEDAAVALLEVDADNAAAFVGLAAGESQVVVACLVLQAVNAGRAAEF